MDWLIQSEYFENLLELNQTLLLKENLIIMDCSTSMQIYKKLWRLESIYFKSVNRATQLSLQT
jgi:heme oxygenase